MAVLENVFSWSKSRDEQFRECQRKYFYDKYASWGGWDLKSPREARMAYVLKNLKNRWAWKGETVHHVIEQILKSLRSGHAVPMDAALEQLTETMRANWRASRDKKNWDDPKRNLGLFEHEYQKPVSDDTWKKIHDESAACLKNFYRSGLYAELLKEDAKHWLVIEDLEEFPFEGSRVYVKLDFARKKDGVIEIYDWKTGKADSEGASVQIGAYALYAMRKWQVPLGGIRAFLFNLSFPFPSPNEQKLDEALLDRTRAAMRESIAAMHALLADPAKNIPKPAKMFQYTDNPKFCDNCNFHKICEKFAPAHALPA